jgi:guanylate kinase
VSQGGWRAGYRLTDSYGTTFAALSALHPKRCILDIDLQGVLQLREKAGANNLSPVYLFLSPPSTSALRERLSGRGTETPESIRKRLDAAKKELLYAMEGEHRPDVVIVNQDLEEAGKKLEAVALGKEGWEGVGEALPKFDVSELDA